MRKQSIFGVVIVLCLGAFAGTAWGTNPFDDIAGNNHEANIDLIYNAGITSGCTPSQYCPNNTVTRGQMATFLGRGLGLGANLPRANARSDAQTYCHLAATRPATFPAGPCAPSLAYVDPASSVGSYTDIAIGRDGLPVISYHDEVNDTLKVAHCSTLDCAGAAAVTTVDSSPGTGTFTSIAIGADGFPIVSYDDTANTALKVAHCSTLTCEGSASIFTVDSAGVSGPYSSIAIASDGNPAIAYFDAFLTALLFAKCNDPFCSAPVTPRLVDNAGDVGSFASLAIGADGLPVISYRDESVGRLDLKVAHCAKEDCSTPATITAVDDGDHDTGWYTSLAIGVDGFPIISYYDSTDLALRLAHCTAADCASSALTTIDGTAPQQGVYTSIAIGTDGRPVISYGWDVGGDLRFARCGNTTCIGDAPSLTTLDWAGSAGRYNSIAIAADGQPVISYWDGRLKVARPAAY